MSSGGDNPEHDNILRHNGIDHYRAEKMIVLSQVHSHVGSFSDSPLEQHRGNWGLGGPQIKSPIPQSTLHGPYDLPEILLHFRPGPEQFQSFHAADNQRKRQALGKDL